MTSPSDIEQRLEALEIKASFAEDAIDKLDQVIVRQQHTIDALVAQVLALRDQATQSGVQRNLRDELPPHY